MRTVTFQSVLNGAATALGLNPAKDLNPARAASLTEYIRNRLKKCWKFEFWPEWTPSEARMYRDVYDNAKAYAAPALGKPVEVFFPATVSYYQALTATTGNAPAQLVNGVWETDGRFWALSWQTYGQPVWPTDNPFYWGLLPPPGFSAPDWQPNTVYHGGAVGTAGDQVRNPGDNQFYQCFTAHTSGGIFDASKFGLLAPFNKYIALDQTGQTPMDEVKRVCKRDPYVYPKTPGEMPFRISERGVQLKSDAPSIVYVEFRRRVPQFTSTPWNGTATFAAGAVTYSTTSGECYVALQNVPANTDPSNPANAAYWSKQDFPAILEGPVKLWALADAYRDQKQTDRADAEEERAREEIQDVWDEVKASQGQFDSALVEIYGG